MRWILLMTLVLVLVLVFWGGMASAAVQGHEVVYTDGNTILKGYIAFDPELDETRPGVLVVYEWWGHN